jgi:glycosyltransferase involved in cell wall biosynthesis
MPQRVAIVQRVITNYRVAFLNRLSEKLACKGIELIVFAGKAHKREGFVDALDELRCGVRVKNIDLGCKIYWQSIFWRLQKYDLVIVEQANAALLNYALFLSRWVIRRPSRLAYWGHGATMQSENSGLLRGWLKRTLTGAVDHWFAYTEMSANIVVETGYPHDQITVVNNSVDTHEILAATENVQRQGRDAVRQALGLAPGFIAVFCSRLYEGKKLGFLLEATAIVRRHAPDFQCIIIGDGPERSRIEAAARAMPWIRFPGALYGRQKANYLAAADVMVLPAWVGLSILDGFAASLPVVSADFRNHSPEIAYLEHGRNGLMTVAAPEAYATALLSLRNDPNRCAAMSLGAAESGRRYSLDQMVERFAKGVGIALTL